MVHGDVRNSIVTGSIQIQCIPTTTTPVSNQLDITFTVTPNKTTQFEFDVEHLSAPGFKFDGFYEVSSNNIKVPLPAPVNSGTKIIFTLPPSSNGLYFINMSGFSSVTTASYTLYSIKAKW